MLKSQHVTFDELSERLRTYEQKYGYSTIQFYRRYRDGELDGDDDDLMLWAGLYAPVSDFAAGSPVYAERV